MAAFECRGLVLHEHGGAPRVEAIAVRDPGPGEVRVRMRVAGVCHTDLAAVRDARFVPMLLGHEGAGVVEACGPGTRGTEPGTAVLLCWRTPCGYCRRDRRARRGARVRDRRRAVRDGGRN
jgi:S-(hydroxymethyl)mycothiol dehydrogenase